MAEGGLSGKLLRLVNRDRNQTQSSLTGHDVDKKTLDKVQRQLEKLVRFCSDPRLGLERSPPFLLDLLPHMFQTLQEIFKNYDSNISELNNNQYFRLFIDNVLAKLRRGTKLFRENRNVFHENTTERKTLTRLSLHISHMLHELKALFPKGAFIGAEYRITKSEAADFWKRRFGDKVIIPWKTFRATLSEEHQITSTYEAFALKFTIDLTNNDMVSVFEFDVFTRLFQPWDTILINWKMIAVTHTGYQAFLTYREVMERLQKNIDKPGSYLFRLSCTRLGQWAIGYVTEDHQILQTIPNNKSLCEALIRGAQDGYYLYPDGKDKNPDLTVIQHDQVKKVIQVTEEEYEIYTSMGTTMQQCKICQENDKDVKLQPCNHLLCSECLEQWQEHDKSTSLTCPFCRAPVKDYESVKVDPFQKMLEEGAGPSWKTPAPPIPDRSDKKPASKMTASPKGRVSMDSGVPSRPPPLPPTSSHPTSRNAAPKRRGKEQQPPPILSDPPPPLPTSAPPPWSTPGDEAFSSAAPPALASSSQISATNPFFSDMQEAIRNPEPNSTPDPEKRVTNYANVEYFGSRSCGDSSAGGPSEIKQLTSDTRRNTVFAQISIPYTAEEVMYNNEDPVSLFDDGSWASSTGHAPSVTAHGSLFDESPPPPLPKSDPPPTVAAPPAISEELYCNVPVTSASLVTSSSLVTSASTLSNIELRPLSLYDGSAENNFFEPSPADHQDEPGNDIYENHPPSEPLSTRDRLLGEGYTVADVDRAMDIVGENEEMVRKILTSFVARN